MTDPNRPRPLRLEQLEGRENPAAGSLGLLAVGADAGGIPEVRLVDATTGEVRASFLAYDVGFRGGVRVALGDIDNDGQLEVVTAPGPGGGPDIRIFDTAGQLERGFLAYDPNFRGGANVDVGRLNGRTVIVTGAGLGGGPHVQVFDGVSLQVLTSFFAYAPSFIGGVTVAVGDVLGDGRGAIVTGPGPGGGPHIKVFDPNGQQRREFFAYADDFRGGVVVAAGNVAELGRDAVVTGAGPGGGPQVSVFDAVTGETVNTFFAYADSFRGGVAVAVVDNGVGNRDTLITGASLGAVPQVNVYNRGFAGGGFFDPFSFNAFPAFFTGGLAFGGGFGLYQPLLPLYDPLFGPGSYYDGFLYPDFLTPQVVATETYFTDPAFLDPGFGDPLLFDPAFNDPFLTDPGFVDPAFVDPVFLDPGLGGFDPAFGGFYDDPSFYADPSYYDGGFFDPGFGYYDSGFGGFSDPGFGGFYDPGFGF